MNLGIIAHNSKKVLIEDFCIAYKNILAKHEVYATGSNQSSRSQVSCRKYRRRQAVYGDGRASGSGYGDPVL